MADHTLTLGQSISTAIAAGAAGDRYFLASGTYRGQQFFPKLGDSYFGDPGGGTIISGAGILSGTWTNVGSLWKTIQQTIDGSTNGAIPAPNTSAVVTATISGANPSVMTVTAVTSGTVIGSRIWNRAGTIPVGTRIASFGTGTGGNGTYILDRQITAVGSGTVFESQSNGATTVNGFENFMEDLYIDNVRQTRMASPGPATVANLSASVTITAANPAVVTWTASSFAAGRQVYFSSTGALPSGINPGQVYYVMAAGLGTNSFQISAYPGTAAISTLGATQSGVHTSNAPGNWWFDTNDNSVNVFATSNPSTGHAVEYAYTPYLMYDQGAGQNRNVIWSQITCEKFATKATGGIIHGARGWTFKGSQFNLAHGIGLVVGEGCTIKNCKFNDNGQAGLEGSPSDDLLVEYSEFARNDWAGFDPQWDAGGMKLTPGRNMQIRGNDVHDNYGNGIWADSESSGVIISGNSVRNSVGWGLAYAGSNGIMHEISHGISIIRNNVVSGCIGLGIFVSNSNGVEVCGNIVFVAGSASANILSGGICAVNEARGNQGGSGALLELRDLYVHDNLIVHPAGDGTYNGIACGQAITAPNWRWNNNTYITADTTTIHWNFDPISGASNSANPFTWATLQAAGIYETGGTQLVGSTTTPSAVLTSLRDGQAAGSITPLVVRTAFLAELVGAGFQQQPRIN